MLLKLSWASSDGGACRGRFWSSDRVGNANQIVFCKFCFNKDFSEESETSFALAMAYNETLNSCIAIPSPKSYEMMTYVDIKTILKYLYLQTDTHWLTVINFISELFLIPLIVLILKVFYGFGWMTREQTDSECDWLTTPDIFWLLSFSSLRIWKFRWSWHHKY